MADIILLDGRGEPATYSGVNVVEFDTVDGDKVQYHEGNKTTKSYKADFSEGNQIEIIPEKEIVTEITIEKPSELLPENIRKDKNIGGVVGTMIESSGIDGNLLLSGDIEKIVTNLESVRDYAFYGMDNLKELEAPMLKTSSYDTFYRSPTLERVVLGETVLNSVPPTNNAITVPMSVLRDWQLAHTKPFKQDIEKNLMRYTSSEANGTELNMSIYAEVGETIIACIASRGSLILSEGWTLLHQNPPTDSINQQLSFAYINVSETGTQSITFSQVSSVRIYVSLIVLKNVKSLQYVPEKYHSVRSEYYSPQLYSKDNGKKVIWGLSSTYWSNLSSAHFWETEPKDCTIVQRYDYGQARVGAIIDFGETLQRKIQACVHKTYGENLTYASDNRTEIDAIEVEFNEEV